MIGKVQKWGNSQGIRIPKNLLAEASISEGDEVEISVKGNKIIIFHPKRNIKKYSLEEMFSEYKVEDKSEEIDWGELTGKEEW